MISMKSSINTLGKHKIVFRDTKWLNNNARLAAIECPICKRYLHAVTDCCNINFPPELIQKRQQINHVFVKYTI